MKLLCCVECMSVTDDTPVLPSVFHPTINPAAYLSFYRDFILLDYSCCLIYDSCTEDFSLFIYGAYCVLWLNSSSVISHIFPFRGYICRAYHLDVSIDALLPFEWKGLQMRLWLFSFDGKESQIGSAYSPLLHSISIQYINISICPQPVVIFPAAYPVWNCRDIAYFTNG